MNRRPWLALLVAFGLLSQACNMQRVLDPSLPTSTLASAAENTATPLPATPTLPPLTDEARIDAGDRALFNGDWDAALREFQTALGSSEDANLQAAALLGMGRSYIEKEDWAAARESLNTLLQLYPDAIQRAAAHILLARIQETLEDSVGAAASYQNYLDEPNGLLDSYAHEWRGDALYDALDYNAAIAAYEAARSTERLGDDFSLQIKIGNSHLALQNYQAAIQAYQTVYSTTINDYLKADTALLMGRAYIALGENQQAYTLFLEAVNNYPLSFSSYAALVELVDAGIPVDEYQRGLVDYYAATNSVDSAAQELYIVAIAAFDRYLQAQGDDHTDDVHFYRALARRASGDTAAAIADFDHMISQHAFDEHWLDAYREKARTLWLYEEDYDAAIQTLLSFVAATPSQPDSAEFLYLAGRIAQNGGRLTRAAELWQRVATEYPASDFAYDALFLAGISTYQLEDYAGAQSLFLQAYQAALSLEDQSQSTFWVAKSLQVQGDDAGAQNAFQQTAAIDPTGYYSERAKDLLAGLDPFEPPADYSFEYDIEAEKAEAEAWIRSTFNLTADADLSSPGPLLNDIRFQRGLELWHLGDYEAARAEFENLRESLVTDAANSYRLANVLIDLGLYRSGIFAIREVLNLAGMSDAATMNAPTYFNRVRFGSYYSDIVLPITAADGLDPLFFYSMMRQESLFEGFVTSVAGARGLMQIVPSTGQEIATLTGWPPDFEADDLYRPMVSIRLGADYLAIQNNAFDDDMYAVLAAYNAGPGSATYWLGLADGDQDLFLEVIDFAETGNHIRSIYELFTIYRNLYAQ
jgi:soluble lytic murein transglycosylase